MPGTPSLLKADWLLVRLGWVALSTPHPQMSYTWGTLLLCLSPTLAWILGPGFLLFVGPCLFLWRTALGLLCPAGLLNSLPGCGKLPAHSCLMGFHFCRGDRLAVVGIRKKPPFFHGERAGGLRPEGKGRAQPCWPRLAKSCGSLGPITRRPNLASSEQLLSVSRWTVWLTRGPTGRELFSPG